CRDHPPTTLSRIKYFCPPCIRSSTTWSPACRPGRMTTGSVSASSVVPPGAVCACRRSISSRVKDSGTIKKSASRVKRWSTFTSSGSARVTVPNITATGAAASTAVRAACRIAFSMSDHLQRDGHRMIGAVEPVRHLVHHHRLVDTERLDDDRQVHAGANPDVADCLQLERALLPVLERSQSIQKLIDLSSVHLLIHGLVQLQHAPAGDVRAVLHQVDLALAGLLVIFVQLDPVVRVGVDISAVFKPGHQAAVADVKTGLERSHVPERQGAEVVEEHEKPPRGRHGEGV